MGHFCVSGAFSSSHRSNLSLIPKTMFDACIQNFFRVSTLYRVGGGRTAREFRKGSTVLRGTREMTDQYEYCSTAPTTFVQDCRQTTLQSLLNQNVGLYYLQLLQRRNSKH